MYNIMNKFAHIMDCSNIICSYKQMYSCITFGVLLYVI